VFLDNLQWFDYNSLLAAAATLPDLTNVKLALPQLDLLNNAKPPVNPDDLLATVVLDRFVADQRTGQLGLVLNAYNKINIMSNERVAKVKQSGLPIWTTLN
jgi:hypothetical protein